MLELAEMFPDEASAQQWFEKKVWADGRCCPRCGSINTCESSHAKMPYWCSDCRSYFSVRTGTLLESSKVSFRKWVWAIYLHLTSLKGVSSMKLHRDIGVSQPTAWYMLQRIRKAFEDDDEPPFDGEVEVDESYFGGKESNKHAKDKLNAGRGTVGKTAVVGMKSRDTNKVQAQVVENTDKATLQRFVIENTTPDTIVYTDEARAYAGIPREHQAVGHKVGDWVREQAHTNGLESFWAMLKRGYQGTYHWMSRKHLHRYIAEFSGRHGIRPLDTIDQMGFVAQGMVGKRLKYKNLISG